MRCGTIGSCMPISCHFRDCKALLVTSLTHVSGAIASVQASTSNDMKLVQWPLMGGLLHLVQRGLRRGLGRAENRQSYIPYLFSTDRLNFANMFNTGPGKLE